MLSLLYRYEPEGDEEVFDIMNILEGLLNQSSAAVVLAVCKMFLALTAREGTPLDMQEQVLVRLKGPLLTLVSSSWNSQELAYSILSQIHVLLSRCADNAKAGQRAEMVKKERERKASVDAATDLLGGMTPAA